MASPCCPPQSSVVRLFCAFLGGLSCPHTGLFSVLQMPFVPVMFFLLNSYSSCNHEYKFSKSSSLDLTASVPIPGEIGSIACPLLFLITRSQLCLILCVISISSAHPYSSKKAKSILFCLLLNHSTKHNCLAVVVFNKYLSSK